MPGPGFTKKKAGTMKLFPSSDQKKLRGIPMGGLPPSKGRKKSPSYKKQDNNLESQTQGLQKPYKDDQISTIKFIPSSSVFYNTSPVMCRDPPVVYDIVTQRRNTNKNSFTSKIPVLKASALSPAWIPKGNVVEQTLKTAVKQGQHEDRKREEAEGAFHVERKAGGGIPSALRSSVSRLCPEAPEFAPLKKGAEPEATADTAADGADAARETVPIAQTRGEQTVSRGRKGGGSLLQENCKAASKTPTSPPLYSAAQSLYTYESCATLQPPIKRLQVRDSNNTQSFEAICEVTAPRDSLIQKSLERGNKSLKHPDKLCSMDPNFAKLYSLLKSMGEGDDGDFPTNQLSCSENHMGKSSPNLLLIDKIPASENYPTESFMIDLLKSFLISMNLLNDKTNGSCDSFSHQSRNTKASESFIKDLFKDTLTFLTNDTNLNAPESLTATYQKNELKIPQTHYNSPLPLDAIQKDIDTFKTNLANFEDYRRKNNVKIRGIPDSIPTSQLKSYISKMVSHLIPNINDNFLIEKFFRIRRPPSLPLNTPTDIIVTFFPNWTRNMLLNISKEPGFHSSPYSHLTFFKDLSRDTLQKRKAFSLITRSLLQAGIPYTWTQSSTLRVNFASKYISIISVEEGVDFLDSAGIYHSLASSKIPTTLMSDTQYSEASSGSSPGSYKPTSSLDSDSDI